MAIFSHLIFYVKDVLISIKFYQEAFGFKPKFIHESNQYAEVDTGNAVLAFASDKLGDSNLPNGFTKNNVKEKPLGCEIVFTVDNVHGSFEQAKKAGAIELASPSKKPWGQIIAYVRDPNGVLIEIASKMG